MMKWSMSLPISLILCLSTANLIALDTPPDSTIAEASRAAMDILQAENNQAAHYNEIKAHMELANVLYENDFHYAAFRVLENARKIFGDNVFDLYFPSYRHSLSMILNPAMLMGLPIEKIEKAYKTACQKDPDYAVYGDFLDRHAEDIKKSANTEKVKDGLLEMRKNAKINGCVEYKSFAARFLLKAAKDPANALGFYLDLYFDDPHYYDGEFAEFRIKEMAKQLQTAELPDALKEVNGNIPEFIQKNRFSRPYLLLGWLKSIAGNMTSAEIPNIIATTTSPDMAVQNEALRLLLAHPELLKDHSQLVANMAKSDNYTQQAISCFLLAKALPEEEFKSLFEPLRQSKVVLIGNNAQHAYAVMTPAQQQLFRKSADTSEKADPGE